ncbi:MAG: CPBP family intramembrane glutamic endopeptidase [Gemmatimonadaceae bacterium]
MSVDRVGLVGLLFLVFFGAVLPLVAYRARNRLTSMRPRPTRGQLYPTVLIQLTFFLILGVLAAWQEGVALWRWPEQYALPALATLLMLGAMVVATRPIKRAAIERRDARVYFAMPDGHGEMALWIAVSIMAGIAEEFVYRWVFSDLAIRLTGSVALAWTLAVLAFSVAHANQGARSMLVIALFSLVAHVLVYVTGTLLFALLLHAAYDVIAGFEYVRLGQQLGYPPHGLPDADWPVAVTTPQPASSP